MVEGEVGFEVRVIYRCIFGMSVFYSSQSYTFNPTLPTAVLLYPCEQLTLMVLSSLLLSELDFALHLKRR